MITSNIAATKSQLSRLIEFVKQGETIIITERNKPVATLQPIRSDSEAGLEAIRASGLLSPPERSLDLEAFLGVELPSLPAERSLSRAILEEREEGR